MLGWRSYEVCYWYWDSGEQEWVFECEDIDYLEWVALQSPTAVKLRPTGEKFGEKDVLSIDSQEGPWDVKGHGTFIDRDGIEKEAFQLQDPVDGKIHVEVGRYAGFLIPVGPGKYVMREPGKK